MSDTIPRDKSAKGLFVVVVISVVALPVFLALWTLARIHVYRNRLESALRRATRNGSVANTEVGEKPRLWEVRLDLPPGVASARSQRCAWRYTTPLCATRLDHSPSSSWTPSLLLVGPSTGGNHGATSEPEPGTERIGESTRGQRGQRRFSSLVEGFWARCGRTVMAFWRSRGTGTAMRWARSRGQRADDLSNGSSRAAAAVNAVVPIVIAQQSPSRTHHHNSLDLVDDSATSRGAIPTAGGSPPRDTTTVPVPRSSARKPGSAPEGDQGVVGGVGGVGRLLGSELDADSRVHREARETIYQLQVAVLVALPSRPLNLKRGSSSESGSLVPQAYRAPHKSHSLSESGEYREMNGGVGEVDLDWGGPSPGPDWRSDAAETGIVGKRFEYCLGTTKCTLRLKENVEGSVY